jgi:hypothetical protein
VAGHAYGNVRCRRQPSVLQGPREWEHRFPLYSPRRWRPFP